MFSRQLFDAAATLVQKIQAQPFNQELAAGTLPAEKFHYYLAQDRLYLIEFSRALTLTAARLIPPYSGQFIQFTLETLKAEQDLHHYYLQKTLVVAEQNPASFMYTNYLLRLASTAAVEVAVASLVPCFWTYQQVAQRLMAASNRVNNPYRAWIELYASADYDLSVSAITNILDELAAAASASLRADMQSAFMRAAQLEWLFWDSAYRLETWPIA